MTNGPDLRLAEIGAVSCLWSTFPGQPLLDEIRDALDRCGEWALLDAHDDRVGHLAEDTAETVGLDVIGHTDAVGGLLQIRVRLVDVCSSVSVRRSRCRAV